MLIRLNNCVLFRKHTHSFLKGTIPPFNDQNLADSTTEDTFLYISKKEPTFHDKVGIFIHSKQHNSKATSYHS